MFIFRLFQSITLETLAFSLHSHQTTIIFNWSHFYLKPKHLVESVKGKKKKKKAKALWSQTFNSASLKPLVSNTSWILFKFEFSIAIYSVREIPLIVKSLCCGISILTLANCNYSCALEIWHSVMNPLFMWFLKTKIFFLCNFSWKYSQTRNIYFSLN